MIGNEELMTCYGRGVAQDFVTRSQDMNDAIYYLRMERWSEVLKMTSFETTDLIDFERRTVSVPQAHGIGETFIIDRSD